MKHKPSLIEKHSVVIAGHKTSISLEPLFWDALKEIASLTERPLAVLVAYVDEQRTHANLSSALRLYALEYYQKGVEA